MIAAAGTIGDVLVVVLVVAAVLGFFLLIEKKDI